MKYAIGVDFGTLSARALLVSLKDGAQLAEAEFIYPHAVMQDKDFSGITLKKSDAFQHPQDYLDALSFVVNKVLEGVDPGEVAGIGIDFTACTALPVTEDGTPLCFLPEFQNEPQAYAKLWKHQSAQKEADDITALAAKEQKAWLGVYGGKISPEWYFPKLLEVYRKAPAVFSACHRYMEAGDWLTWLLTGNEIKSSCMAGYKAIWNHKDGFPENAFWEKLEPGFGNIIGTKVGENVGATGTNAGGITAHGSKLTGLKEGTAVAIPIIDAHAALPASGIAEPGKLMLIVGTSGCHIVMSEKDRDVSGISGRVYDGIIPGLVAYEAGQAATGDSFDWFVKNCVPAAYHEKAKEDGKNLFAYLTEKAETLQVGESGLLALDWWNGNRCPYSDGELSGVILGLNLRTKPEEIFRAILESTAYGTKAIADIYETNGIEIHEVYAAGGIAQKNAFLMQMYADVLGKPIHISPCAQAGAMGSAIFAAAAGGAYPDTKAAAKAMAEPYRVTYTPDPQRTSQYEKLYRAYLEVSEFFAHSNVMKDLRK